MDYNLECIVHYGHLKNIEKCSACYDDGLATNSSYSKIKVISAENEIRIRDAKRLRERLGGENHHAEQCSSIPDIIDKSKHGIHMTPCFKKFTLILCSDKQETCEIKSEKTNAPLSDKPSSSSINPGLMWKYPKECYLCNKYQVQYRNNKVYPITIRKESYAETMKAAAKAKNKEMYEEIKDLCFFTKGFKTHKHCSREFTRGFTAEDRKKAEVAEVESEEVNDQTFVTSNVGNFDAVCNHVKEFIIKQNQVISMEGLHRIYGLKPTDNRYRNKLKLRILKTFPNEVTLVPTDNNGREIVVNSDSLHSHVKFRGDNEANIKDVALSIRQDILNYAARLPRLSWPPTIDELSSAERNPPSSVRTFLTHLLTSEKHNVSRSENHSRLVDSYASDLIHGVTGGKVITAKHFSLGLGLHSMTGQKDVVRINNKLGHCISYDSVCDIETAQAQASQAASATSTILPLKPASEHDIVLTHFWVDNFDIKVECQEGGGSVNTTHLVAFQEPCANSIDYKEKINVPRSKSRKIKTDIEGSLTVSVNKKAEPFSQVIGPSPEFVYDEQLFTNMYFLWLFMRKQNSYDQLIPSLSGWLLKERSKCYNSRPIKTIETYLPPITSKVTDFKTIDKYIQYLQTLANDVNMSYINITLDMGAAINAYKLIWHNQNEFSNVIIHPGDFHFLKENFLVIGTIVKASGFEDVIFQSEICSSGSLNGVLSASHYNRAWAVHNCFSEALERLFLVRFIAETKPTIPEDLLDTCADPDLFEKIIVDKCASLLFKYESFRLSVRNGHLGKTAQFWTIYLDLMRLQCMGHTATQENDYDMRLYTWSSFLPYYFALNKVNYARYGSLYVETLKKIDIIYPGLKELIEEKGMSVQAQDRHHLRTAIDQRGEQSINRDAKTAGGISRFASQSSTVLKWCLNRPAQAKNTNALKKMAGIKGNTEGYKPMRPSAIVRSEKKVTKAIKVLEEEYINPFGVSVDPTHLFNLSSGSPVPDDIAKEILDLPKKGMELKGKFFDERLFANILPFHDPIKQNKYKTFEYNSKTLEVKKGDSYKIVEVNRNILGALISFSAKTGRSIDFEKALQYPLCPIPLSLAHPDGSRRETSKSELLKIVVDCSTTTPVYPNHDLPRNGSSSLVVDIIALLRIQIEIPETYEELILKVLKSLPSSYSSVHLVADTYREISIKFSERIKRGSSPKILISSVNSKIPRDFSSFMKNGDNKSRLIELFREYIITNKAKALNILRTNHVFISTDNDCQCITLSSVSHVDILKSNHEEADTKVILHCLYSLQKEGSTVLLRSPSADTDIFILAVSALKDVANRAYLDYGSGSHRKGTWLHLIDISSDCKDALIGLHAFTGNDFASSFFRRGKKKCWNLMKSQKRFIQAFQLFGNEWQLDRETFLLLEEFVCHLYGYKKKDVNSVRHDMFMKKYVAENKFVDMSTLPPCRSSLQLHLERCNHVGKTWKLSNVSMIYPPPITSCGWHNDGTIQWIEEPFPDDITDILFDPNFSPEGDCGNESETDEED